MQLLFTFDEIEIHYFATASLFTQLSFVFSKIDPRQILILLLSKINFTPPPHPLKLSFQLELQLLYSFKFVDSGCKIWSYTLRKKCPYSEVFWSVFSDIGSKCIGSKCGKIRTRITPNKDIFHAVQLVCPLTVFTSFYVNKVVKYFSGIQSNRKAFFILRIELSRQIIPALVLAIKTCRARERVNSDYFYELLFTRANLKLVHTCCHDKGTHVGHHVDRSRFFVTDE